MSAKINLNTLFCQLLQNEAEHLFQPPAARSSLKWMMNENFISFMKSLWPQKLLLGLWVKNGRVTWFKSVVGTANKVSP